MNNVPMHVKWSTGSQWKWGKQPMWFIQTQYQWMYLSLDLWETIYFLKSFQVPEGCDLVAAGALPVAFGTSHVALVHRARLTSGQVSHIWTMFSALNSFFFQTIVCKRLSAYISCLLLLCIVGFAGSWGSRWSWDCSHSNWKGVQSHCYCCC